MNIITGELSKIFSNDNIESLDLFICSSSFEERCKKIPKQVILLNPKQTLIATNIDFDEYLGMNASALAEIFGDQASILELDSKKPLYSADQLSATLSRALQSRPKTILIDITTFMHESLLMLLFLLREKLHGDENVFLGYTSADEYSIGEDVESKWLSKGTREVRTVLGYAGESVPSKGTHLIVLVGFEVERAERAMRSLEPSCISLGHGDSKTHTSPKHENSRAHFEKLVRKAAAWHSSVNHFNFSCSDPVEARNAIIEQMEQNKEYNQVLVPMNTKLSTVGAALASFQVEKLQICYVRALQYNYKGYSTPSTKGYLIEFPEIYEKNNLSISMYF